MTASFPVESIGAGSRMPGRTKGRFFLVDRSTLIEVRSFTDANDWYVGGVHQEFALRYGLA